MIYHAKPTRSPDRAWPSMVLWFLVCGAIVVAASMVVPG